MRVSGGAAPAPVATGAPERVAAGVAHAIALRRDLAEETFEQRSRGDVCLEDAGRQGADRFGVRSDLLRLPRRERWRPVVPVPVPGPAGTDARSRWPAPPVVGGVVVEREQAATDVARVRSCLCAPFGVDGRTHGVLSSAAAVPPPVITFEPSATVVSIVIVNSRDRNMGVGGLLGAPPAVRHTTVTAEAPEFFSACESVPLSGSRSRRRERRDAAAAPRRLSYPIARVGRVIACVYCGGEHDRPADVKQCWADHQDSPVGVTDDVGSVAPSDAGSTATRRPSPTREIDVPDAPVLDVPVRRGPAELGRNVVIGRGHAVPTEWLGCTQIEIDGSVVSSPAEVLVELREAARDRRGVVVSLGDDAGLETLPTSVDEREPYLVGVAHSFPADELHHLVWSNSIDARDGDVGHWPLIDRAGRHGATVQPGDGPGDIVTPDGRTVWLDGGPIRFTAPIDGVEVVHALQLEHGRFDAASSNESGADLAADQLAAVTHTGGAARIIAPAGSGKTRVLTERARHLLTRWNVPPEALTLVAFNKRAQEEMLARTTDLPGLHVRTLNAIALAIINGSPPFATQRRRWRTIDEPDVRRILGSLVQSPRKLNIDPLAPWMDALSLVRLGLVDPSEVGGPLRRRRRWSRRCLAAVPSGPRPGRFGRFRRPDLSGDRGPPHPAGCEASGAARLPPPARRRVPGPDAGPSPPAPVARRTGRRRVRRRRRRSDDLRVQRRGPGVADRLRDLVPRRRGASARGQLPMPGGPRRSPPTGSCGTIVVGSPRRSGPTRSMRADGKRSRRTIRSPPPSARCRPRSPPVHVPPTSPC